MKSFAVRVKTCCAAETIKIQESYAMRTNPACQSSKLQILHVWLFNLRGIPVYRSKGFKDLNLGVVAARPDNAKLSLAFNLRLKDRLPVV